jgi:hypothetical protein
MATSARILFIDLSPNNGYILKLLQRQFRGIDAAPRKLRRVLEVEMYLPDSFFQFAIGCRRRVSERLFDLSPIVLVGIELRCISGEGVQMKALAATQIPRRMTSPGKCGRSRQRNSTTRFPLMLSRWHRKYMPIHLRAEEIAIAEMTGDSVVPIGMAQDRRLVP